ncbi:MAG: DUF4142 domain-containing protein [Acidobacteria bacterium]|nr:MAG: DUF4142 domain-containing protein [Acidobacteriota bacterium]
MSRLKLIPIVVALMVPLGLAAHASQQGQQSKPKQDPQKQRGQERAKGTTGMTAPAFAEEAASGGTMEVKLGQLAASKASDPEVKSFAQRMVTDHGKANAELKKVAGQKSYSVSEEMNAKHKQMSDRLSKLSGIEFDREYMQMMVKDHEEDVEKFKEASQSLDDPALKQWASKTLPTLQQHLEQARKINAKLQDRAKEIK